MPGFARSRLALCLIFLLTLGTRLGYYMSNPHPIGQPWLWGAIAHNIVSDGHWFQLNANAGPTFSFNAPLKKGVPLVSPDEVNLKYADTHPRWVPFVFEPMGESVLVAGIWWVTGDQSYLAAALLRIILDGFVALLIYRIAIRLFKRRRAALAAGFLYAIYPPIAELVVNASRDFWSVGVTVAIIAVYLEAINSSRQGRWLVVCGVLTGLCTYFNSNVLILPAAMSLAGIAVVGWRTTLYRAFVTTMIAVILVVPWTIRNYNDFHKLIPLRLGLGENLESGMAEVPNPYGLVHSDYAIYELVRRARPNLRPMSPEWDSYLGNRALAVVKAHPLFYLKTIARHIWGSTLGAVDVEWGGTVKATPLSYKNGPFAYILEQPLQLLQLLLLPVVFLLAILSLGFTWTRYRNEHLILIVVVLATAAPYLFLSLEPRYLMPVEALYLIWIGLGSDLLLERVRTLRMGGRSQAQRAVAL
jgi:4-amino-4-deoxy-L-arabinose transferase-like glycosyltransferase